jgi:pyridoxal 5'-phosphate synthase pdxS subunit
MADPKKVQEIQAEVSIPVMAKVRIGHFAEAQILQSLEVDYIDESEVLTPADPQYHIDKWAFTIPFVCGARNLGEACRRIAEGAAMIRTKGEPGTGNVIEAVKHMRLMNEQIREILAAPEEELMVMAKEMGAPYNILRLIRETGRLPVVNFAAGGIATPADAALMMQLGCDGIFVGSGVFKSGDPEKRAHAIVQATTHFNDPKVLAEVSAGLGEAMVGISIEEIPPHEMMQVR